MTSGPTFEDCHPARESKPKWPVEPLVAKIDERLKRDQQRLNYHWVSLTKTEWRQIKALLSRVPEAT